MEQKHLKAVDLSLDPVDSSYDPLSGFETGDEDTDESGGQQGPHTEYRARGRHTKPPDDRSATQRIEDLFSALAPRRRVLLGILEFVDTPRHADVLQSKVDELQKYDRSVYSGYNFSLLLGEAGAMQKVHKDGSVFDETEEQLPDIVEIDGIRFFKPTDGKQVYWLITEEGRAYLEIDDPFDRLAKLISEESRYQPIYKSILEFCNSETGMSAPDLAALIDSDPLLQKPHKTFSYFVKKLEDCHALLWASTWSTTKLGRQGLALLFSEGDEIQNRESAHLLRGDEQ